MSDNFEYGISKISKVRISSIGRVDPFRTIIKAVSPNYFDVVSPTFGNIKFYHSLDELNQKLTSIQGEQLYSPEGMNRMIFPLAYKDEFVLETNNMKEKLALQIYKSNGIEWGETKPLSYLANLPLCNMGKLMDTSLTSLTSFSALYNMGKDYFNSIRNIPLQYLIISYEKDITKEQMNHIKAKLTTLFNMKANISTLEEELEFTKDVRVILNYAFSCITIAFSLIAFFSLSNTMYMNIMEQKQEIGILRSLGLKRFALIKIYMYEGFALLMSAGILGVSIYICYL